MLDFFLTWSGIGCFIMFVLGMFGVLVPGPEWWRSNRKRATQVCLTSAIGFLLFISAIPHQSPISSSSVQAVKATAKEILPSSSVEENYAHKLMVLTNPGFGDQERVEKRYRFIIPKLASSCEDIPHKEKAADMVYFVFKKLLDVGVVTPEDLLNHTEALHRIIQEILPLFEPAKTMGKCAESFVLFLNARTNGLSTYEAREQVIQIYRSMLQP